jgi:hypothetical protein
MEKLALLTSLGTEGLHARLASVRFLHLGPLHTTRVVLALGGIATRSFAAVAFWNAVAGGTRSAATNMDKNDVVTLLIAMLSCASSRQPLCFRNLPWIYTLLGDGLVSSTEGSDAVKMGSTLPTSACGTLGEDLE